MEEQGIEQSTLSLRLSPAEELCYVGTSAVPEHGGAQSKGFLLLQWATYLVSLPSQFVQRWDHPTKKAVGSATVGHCISLA